MFSRRAVTLCFLCTAASCGGDSAVAPDEPPPLPAATEDRVGLPANYATVLKPFYVYDRPDNRQVRVVYGNDAARAGQPYARGAILVMETWRARQTGNVPVLDSNGRYQKDSLTGIFVMRKEKWFGLRYKEHQTGEWEYASYRPDLTPLVVGDAGAQQCAVCHLDAAPSRDWVYRGNIFYANGSGALPRLPATQPADQPIMSSYTFLPASITIKPGTRLTWTNVDQVKHTLTLDTGGFSGLVSQGASLGLTFNSVGTFRFLCAIHSTMRMTVVVAP